MNFFQLECFKAAMENSSFVIAANIMHVTSPTITYQISNLEDELKETLFVRNAKGVTPTQAGYAFYDAALGILNQYHSSLSRFKNCLSSDDSVIRIGFTRPPDNFEYHAAINKYRAENPDVVIDISDDTHINENTAGDIDLLFHTVFDPDEFSGFEFVLLGTIPFYATVGAYSRWADKESISFEDLRDERFLVLDSLKNSKYQVPSIRELKKLGIDYGLCDNVNQLLYSIADNSGISIYPSKRTEIMSGLKRIPMTGMEPLKFGILYRKNHSPAVEDLLCYLVSSLKE